MNERRLALRLAFLLAWLVLSVGGGLATAAVLMRECNPPAAFLVAVLAAMLATLAVTSWIVARRRGIGWMSLALVAMFVPALLAAALSLLCLLPPGAR